ncbi:hypothetical protein KLP40_09825 [Hymenobacter sp. NST-14]|uniref:hypothetical protein n=1 Tax=Hymenobacter piscis TaxID=2839984 RepID=UPI001C03544B|nr:hypothetical protein [Hymenobacter piscis]MBT9393461.1 hypothetical protein [Hymenobacter piscis]
MKYYLVLIVLMVGMNECLGQNNVIYTGPSFVGCRSLKDTVVAHLLIDKLTGVRYILDDDFIHVKAVDKNGVLLWKIDPFIDNKLEVYRIKRPLIIYFSFGLSGFNKCEETKGKAIIKIIYNSKQFGEIDKVTGAFSFVGQD